MNPKVQKHNQRLCCQPKSASQISPRSFFIPYSCGVQRSAQVSVHLLCLPFVRLCALKAVLRKSAATSRHAHSVRLHRQTPVCLILWLLNYRRAPIALGLHVFSSQRWRSL